MGYRIGLGGYLRKENEDEKKESEENGNHQNGNGNGNGNSNGGSNGGGVSESIISEKRDGKSAKDKGYSLRDWFKGGGWKQTGGKYDGKPCAKQPGQTTKPYCRDADDRAAMSKDERKRRFAKKNAEDPNPNRKGKANMVTQNNSFEPEANIVEEEKKKKRDACYHKVKSRYSVWPSAYASGALVKCRKVGAANWGNKSEEMDYASFAAKAKETIKKNKEKTLKGETKTKKEEWIVDNAAQYFFNEGINEDGVNIFIEELGLEEFVSFVEDLFTDTHLTEARAARRARKGSKSYDQVKAEIDAKEAAKKKSSEKTKAAADTAKKQQPKKRPVLDGIARQVLKGMDRHKKAMARAKQDIETTKKIASKIGKGAKEFGKGVKSGVETAGKVAKVAKKAVSENIQCSNWRDDFKAMEYEFIDIIKPEPLVTEEDDKSEISRDKMYQTSDLSRRVKKNMDRMRNDPNHPVHKVLKANAEKKKQQNEESETIDEAGKKCWKGYKKAGTQKLFGKTYNRCVKANEETEVQEATSRPKATQRGKLSKADAQKRQARLDRIAAAKERSGEVKPKTGETHTPKKEKKEKVDPRLERAGNQVLRSIRNEAKDETEIGITGLPIPKKKRSPKKQYEFEKARRKNLGTNVGGKTYEKDVTPYYNPRVKEEVESDWRSEIEEGAAWTKKSGKNPSGGLNEKGRKSYERENPGSDLKRPSKKKGNKRRASFCARMKGMKKKLTSSKTANDPDSRINKSLRAWNC